MSVDQTYNLVAVGTGMLGLFAALVYLIRDPTRDLLESMATAVFIFMQSAIWGVEVYFWVMIVLRLLGRGGQVP